MTFDTVLRIKRKRTDDALKVLLTSESSEPQGKKRRVWKLSRSADSRGIPIPISVLPAATDATSCENQSLTQATILSPPRFSVRKRKASESFTPKKSQRIFDLEREETIQVKSIRSLAESDALNAMLSEYLAVNDLTHTSNSSLEDDYVYDIYYPQATTQAIEDATAALRSNYGLLEHFDWEASEQLIVDDDDRESDGAQSDDSNAEDWAGNDYPDEEDFHSSDGSLVFRGSEDENDESFDRDDWD
ncbi:Putative transcription factor iwr1 [Taphrina deformans PYCC 5710]|uniref:Probable RNA polymerase II nuclear localization protein SLC7A6OS n=1 Tax=Taphrina deformans (strain PYCC 5710 / ATCC 11124 / CBS 356.35 / IMI 108563 / JCM 9778 / NBRC 8474) TaxID=1097556 RepID=R4XA81_TAPDE|nr:Putative transcription factor iwr1 [Taphrina deformans PYCC 5710]|eukprot:CCG82657.1 Putative transcription factor iwr1 [Taphrina deformans PYCC 5710]